MTKHNKDYQKLIDTLTDEQILLFINLVKSSKCAVIKAFDINIDLLEQELDERDRSVRKIMFASGKGS